MEKYDLLNAFGRSRTLPRYLEICTTSTGMRFAEIEPSVFPVRHRLLYRCPATYDDGQAITFRTTGESSHELVRAMQVSDIEATGYDVILVDPYHTYFCSITDMMGALSLLRPGGVMVVHDCNPDDPAMVGEAYTPGLWCGVTYQAFVDFVLSTHPAGHYVIDSDYGCGVVHTSADDLPPGLPTRRPTQPQVFEWTAAQETAETAYAYFDRNRQALLNLVTPDDYAAACGWPQPGAQTPNMIANPNWEPVTEGWRTGSRVEALPVEIVAGGSLGGPAGEGGEPRGILLQGRLTDPGAELDALWPAQANPAISDYGPTFGVEAQCEYSARVHALPCVGALQLLLVFMGEDGVIIQSPRRDVRPPLFPTAGAAPEWQLLTVTGKAPDAARTATILFRLINTGATPVAPSALLAQAVFATLRPKLASPAMGEAVFRIACP